MAGIKPVMRDIRDAVLHALEQLKNKLHRVVDNAADGTHTAHTEVHGIDRFDEKPDVAGGHPGPSIREGATSRGQSDGGPGVWAESPKRTKGEEYQEFVTGMERGTEYRVNGVNFDGFDSVRGVLLDAKDWRRWPPADKYFWHPGVLEEIARQFRAGEGLPIEWHFSSQDAKDAVDRLLFHERMTGQIRTVFTPFGD